jgi:hypothetical protein
VNLAKKEDRGGPRGGSIDLSDDKRNHFADMPLGGKKKPALAIALGDMGEEPEDDETETDDEGADGEEEALQKAGDAAIEALHANDALAFMKALVAGVKASGAGEEDIEGADVDLSDHEGGYDPPKDIKPSRW